MIDRQLLVYISLIPSFCCRLITVTYLINSTMSGGIEALALKEEDVMKFLTCSTHLGSTNVDYQMLHYTYKRKPDGKFMSFICPRIF